LAKTPQKPLKKPQKPPKNRAKNAKTARGHAIFIILGDFGGLFGALQGPV